MKRRKVKLRSEESTGRNIIGRLLYYFSLLAFLAVIVYIVFFSGLLAVNAVEIRGNGNIQADEIKKEIGAKLEGKYLGIISKNNIIFAFTSRWERELREKYKKIDTAEIKRKFPSSLLVSIKERNPVLILGVSDRYFLVDDRGWAFEEIIPESADWKNENWIILKDISNKNPDLDNPVFPSDLANFISQMKNKISADLNINISREAETPSRMSYDIRIRTEEGWTIYFNAASSLEKEIEALRAALDSKINQENRKDLEYIDLRSDNKVYYKFKEGAQEEVRTEEKTAEEQPKKEEKKDKKKH